MRIATYTRISTDEERQPFSLEAQAERLAAYVKSQDDWKIVSKFTDQASGKSLYRPGLSDMLQLASEHGFDLLLVYKVDRVSRSVRALAQILEELDAAGVAFRSATEPFDTSAAAGRMMVQMLGVFAEFERASIVERTKVGLSKKASKGEWTGGTPPFGYSYDKERRGLLVADDEARIVREIFRGYVLRRQGTAAISGWLNDEGIRTRRGNCWSPQKIIDILRNVTHIGWLPYNGEVFPSTHAPIIDEDVFEAAQAILKERAENYPIRRGNASDYLLTGTMRCKNCGHGFIGTDSHGKGGKYRYYTCYVRQRHGTARCDQYRIPAPPVEQGVIASTAATLRDSRLLKEAEAAALAEWKLRTQDKESELAGVKEELRKAETSVRMYMKSFESGRTSNRLFAARVNELEDKINQLEAQQRELMEQIEAAPSLPPEDLLNEAVAKLEHTVANGEPETLKGLLRALIDRIEVNGREHIQPFIRLDGVLTVAGSPPLREHNANSPGPRYAAHLPLRVGRMRSGTIASMHIATTSPRRFATPPLRLQRLTVRAQQWPHLLRQSSRCAHAEMGCPTASPVAGLEDRVPPPVQYVRTLPRGRQQENEMRPGRRREHSNPLRTWRLLREPACCSPRSQSAV